MTCFPCRQRAGPRYPVHWGSAGPGKSDLIMEKLLPSLPKVEDFGINRVTDGPPLPKELDIRWPKFMSEQMKKQWPGVPIPRKWGEEVMHWLPLGIGEEVLDIIDSLGL